MSKIIRLFKRPATTVSGVLKQTADALDREGKWVTGQWISAGYGEPIDPEAPLCSSGWGACADGMLISTVFGLATYEDYGQCYLTSDRYDAINQGTPEQQRLYDEAFTLVSDVAADLAGEDDWNIIDFNDKQTTRSEVVRAFRKAYRRAQYLERTGRLAKASQRNFVAA